MQIGGQLDFQSLHLSIFPKLSIELNKVNLTLPKTLTAEVATLRLFPQYLPLLRGNFRPAQLELFAPQVKLTLPAQTKEQAQPLAPSKELPNKAVIKNLSSMAHQLPEFSVTIKNAQVAIAHGTQSQTSLKDLNLQAHISHSSLGTTKVELETTCSRLHLLLNKQLDNQQITIKEISLDSTLQVKEDALSLSIHLLKIAEPRISLTGDLQLSTIGNQTGNSATKLNLSGSDIDVDATRKTVLAISYGTSPTKEIFDYLRGGRVSHIDFSSHGDTLSELGDLNNIVIKGQLQAGKISIPPMRLDLTEVVGDVTIQKGILQGSKLSARLGKSFGNKGSLQIGLTSDNDLFRLGIDLNADLASTKKILLDIVDSPAFNAELTQFTRLQGTAQGRLTLGDQLADIKTELKVDDFQLSADHLRLPWPLTIAAGQLDFGGNTVSFDNIKLDSQDASITLQGSVEGFFKRPDQIKISFNGSLGPESLGWLSETLKFPKDYVFRTPLHINQAMISYQPDSPISFTSSLAIEEGPAITTNIHYLPTQLQIHQLDIKDQYSDLNIQFFNGEEKNHFAFTGQLQQKTLDAMFLNSPVQIHDLQGDLVADIPATGPAMTTGHLSGDDIKYTFPSGNQAHLEQFIMQGNGQQLDIDINTLSWYQRTWTPVKATINVNDAKADIRLIEARLCGINIPGQLFLDKDTFSLAIDLEAEGIDLASSYHCLIKDQTEMTGTFDITSQITGQIPLERLAELTEKLKGPLKITLHDGVIKQNKLIARTLEILNFTEIVKGRLPNLSSSGFPYKTITLQGAFDTGKLIMENFFMDGETLDVVGKGEVHLKEKTVEAQLLAAPFKTVDTLVKIIPGVNYILAGNLVTIPISLIGPLADPEIKVLPASAVGSGLYNIAERTIKSPFKLMEKILPWRVK